MCPCTPLLFKRWSAKAIFPCALSAVVDWLHDITWGAWLALWVSTGLAVWSLANYTANVWHYFRYVMVDDSSKEH